MCIAYAHPPKLFVVPVIASRIFFWHFLGLLQSPPLFFYGQTNHIESSMFNEVITC